jgi:ADP-ribose pyrophosphatase YjhB (NUDIX family)
VSEKATITTPATAEPKLSGKFCIDCGKATHVVEVEEGMIRNKCLSCGWIDWNPPVFVAVGVVQGKRTDKRTIVLIKRANGKWAMPAGFLNTGEHPSAAGARETNEEGGMTITVNELPVRILTPPGRNQNLMFYLAETSDGVMKFGSDALAVDEFAQDELPEIAYPLHKIVIDQFFAGDFDKK